MFRIFILNTVEYDKLTLKVLPEIVVQVSTGAVFFMLATNSIIYESFVVLFVLFGTLPIVCCTILVVLSGCRTFCVVEIRQQFYQQT